MNQIIYSAIGDIDPLVLMTWYYYLMAAPLLICGFFALVCVQLTVRYRRLMTSGYERYMYQFMETGMALMSAWMLYDKTITFDYDVTFCAAYPVDGFKQHVGGVFVFTFMMIAQVLHYDSLRKKNKIQISLSH